MLKLLQEIMILKNAEKAIEGDPHQLHHGTRVRYYRCSLPGLAGFAAYRREGTNMDHHYIEFCLKDVDYLVFLAEGGIMEEDTLLHNRSLIKDPK